MSERSVAIVFDRTSRIYEAGEDVSGRVRVRLERDVHCRGVRLTRHWATHGRGNPDRGPTHESRLYEGPLHAGETHSFPFSFTAPAAPFTYHGHLLNVDHYVRVDLDLAWARDPHAVEEFVLRPGPASGAPQEVVEQSSSITLRRIGGYGVAFVGALSFLVGLASFPMPGLFFTVVGLAMFLAGMWRRIARTKLGDAGFHLSSRVVAPGERLLVRFFFRPSGRLRLRGIRAEVICREICVSGSGSSRSTHKHTVTREAARISGPMRTQAGRRIDVDGSVLVPENGAYSFRSDANRVEWQLRLTVDIPSWPDWRSERELVVWPVAADLLPAAAGGEADPDAETSERSGARLLPPAELRPNDGAAASVDLAPLPPPWEIEAWEEAPAGEESAGWDESTEWGESTEWEEREADDGAPPPAALPVPDSTAPPRIRDEGPQAAGPVSLDPLSAALSSIAAADRFGGERESRVRALIGTTHAFDLTVDRVERTFGSGRYPEYRGGRTVVGTIARSGAAVVVRFPEVRNEELDAAGRGASMPVRGEVVDWQRLDDRPVVRGEA